MVKEDEEQKLVDNMNVVEQQNQITLETFNLSQYLASMICVLFYSIYFIIN